MGPPTTPYLQVVKELCDLLLEFRTPSISREMLKLETSNFARTLTRRVPTKKIGQSGRKWVM